MPTWCHMFNSTLIGAARVWFDELPPKSLDGYKDMKAAFLSYFMQQKKYVKDPVEIHNIKQRDGETLEDFMERFKIETGRMKGAPQCMRIFGFMHGINNPELTKRLNEHVPKTMEEMMIATTAFIRGEAAAASKKKGHGTPKEILAAEANKFQPPPPMVTPVEKRNSNKFCDFHNDKGHSTDECMQLKKQIEDFEQGKEITFPPLTTNDGTEGPLVIEAEMGGHTIHPMYIDGGSSMKILYEHCFNRLRPEIKSQMVPATTSLTGFSGKTTWPLGQLRLLVTIGDITHSTKAWMNFMTVKSLSPYNGIIGRPGLKAIQAVPSMVHVMLKFLTEEGIVTIRSSLLVPAECTSIDTSSPIPREKTHPANLMVPLHPNFPDQEVVVGGSLSDKGRTELCALLKKNLDIFAWQPSDMTGVPRSIAEHKLNIRKGCPPVRQKKRGQAPERTKAIQAEVQKLVEARIMREVYYHDSLSNPFMVKKHDGSWRMCVDFTDLNKACPQDCYPLPEIDWKVFSLEMKRRHGSSASRPDREIISDNGKQFADNPFKDWCDKLNITQRFASVKHPQSNRLVERANRSLGEGIKARLGEGNRNWVEELPHVLWAHRTMIKSSHGDIPFSLTYGTEAVIPAEIGMPTYRTTAVDVVNNDEELHLNLDLLEERRELAAMSEARSKSKMMKDYNSMIRGVAFKPGDFIYRSNDASHAVAGGKLGPKWEGPYEVTDALGNGAYMLRSTDWTMLPRTWNVTNLKRCYL
nr:reverse transcriptase domain-containing protein [Tanacetum cinerariifolium]